MANTYPEYEVNYFSRLYLPWSLRQKRTQALLRVFLYPLTGLYHHCIAHMAKLRVEAALSGQVLLLTKRLNDTYTSAYTASWQRIVIENGTGPGHFFVKVPIGLQLQGPLLDSFQDTIRRHTIAGNTFTIIYY